MTMAQLLSTCAHIPIYVDVMFRQLDIPFAYWRCVVLSCKVIYLNMMSNKWRVVNYFHSGEIENALRESITRNPARSYDILVCNRCHSSPDWVQNLPVLLPMLPYNNNNNNQYIYKQSRNVTTALAGTGKLPIQYN